MSYQVLARKWRPASFEQVVGQSHVLHALTNALSQQRLHHAYLFTGTRGVGKTSLARLFAKGLNCEQGITATPCGKCASCVEIAQGRFVDLIEVDAASRTKVDDTRELLDNVQYRPTRGRFKVYLIDEVHMLSRSSFNALLKTLEEPPEHVKFLLATTDPQKLPITVLSRCLQFNLKSLNQQEIGTQLDHILTQEQVPNEAAALQLIAKAANGSMRDALSLTDQAIAFGAGQVMLEQVQTMLGSIDERQVISLLEALVNGDVAALMTQADKVLAFGADADEVLRSLLELLHQISLAQFAPAAAQLSLYAEQINHFAAHLAPEQVQLYYQLLLHGRKDLPFAPDPKSGLEMALLRVVAFEPSSTPQRWQGGEGRPLAQAGVASTAAAPGIASATAEPMKTKPVKADPTPVRTLGAGIAVASHDDDDDSYQDASDDNLLQMQAEQNLIMSQADSMGYQPQVDMSAAPEAKHYITDEDDAPAPPFHDDLTGDMFGAPVTTPAPQDAAATPTEYAASATTANQAAPANNDDSFGDDLLDMVIASRDSLLKEIEELSSDDDDSVVSSPGLGPKKVAQEPRGALPEPTPPQSPPPSNNTAVEVEPNTAAVEPAAVSKPVPVNQTAPTIEPPQAVMPAAAPAMAAVQSPAAVTDIASNIVTSLDDEPVPTALSAAPTGHADDLRWYKLVASVEIGGRVRQLAANSVCYTLGEELKLLLKPDQKHLAAKTAIAQMETAMSEALGVECHAVIDVGLDEQRETPREIRRRFNRELLAHAKDELVRDQNVRWLMAQMGAQLDEDSLSYPPEMLAEKTAQIAS
ncbi:DNA polymerase III subunit gamma/tau [Shewanella sp.]|uniref:DNA polymerase III subunit gamma/tau n=1 Tax=Shewanella sp. TaxID=50422 RepID=UPI003A97EEB2